MSAMVIVLQPKLENSTSPGWDCLGYLFGNRLEKEDKKKENSRPSINHVFDTKRYSATINLNKLIRLH